MEVSVGPLALARTRQIDFLRAVTGTIGNRDLAGSSARCCG